MSLGSEPAVIAIDRLETGAFTLRDAFGGESLTPGQEELIAELGRFLTDSSANVFLLKGYAGTGKTFVTRGLGRYLEAQGRAFCLAAPTGRAAKVIAAKSGFYAETLHKKIYDYTKVSEYSDSGVAGSETFKAYMEIKKNDLPANAVFIVDEASLVSDVYQEGEFFRAGSGYLLKDFLTHVGLDHNDHDKKVIFIGDTAQLPPVGMAFSPALDKDYLRKTYGIAIQGYELRDVVRQKADSAVMRNVHPLREALELRTFNKIGFDFDGAEVSRLAPDELMPAYFQSCDYAVNAKSIIISRSNAEAADFNRAARQTFFPGSETVTAGDKLMVVKNTLIEGRYISNGDFIWVKEADPTVETREIALKRKHPDTQEVETATVALAFREVVAGLRDQSGQPFFFRTKILENLLYDNSPGLGSDEQKALYVDFRTRKRNLTPGGPAFKLEIQTDPYFNALQVKFGYALTCHKAQGSEWEHVFVSCPTTQNPLSADAFRWLYTAMTRTSDRLYLVNPPHRTIGGDMGLAGASLTLQAARTEASVATDKVVVPAASNAATFGLSEQDGVMFALLGQVQALLEKAGIEIESIVHNQYQEAYFFRRGEETARLNIAYNARGRVKGVAAVQKNPLSEDLARRLGSLTDGPLPTRTGALEAVGPGNLSRPFLQEYHDRLEPMLRDRRIRIASLVERAWCVRYAFERDGEVATIDIWYNGRSMLTTCQPVDNACNVGPLLPEVVALLTSGLKA
ncbi:ATP-dependent DNA helicase [Brevundimonas sp. DC300-4]|uniref:ATP-dependent DNA helicase n=1 Tax=Brevundimonas sp. DC300-4 TaxID=2804594 RepID=UPI003CF91357